MCACSHFKTKFETSVGNCRDCRRRDGVVICVTASLCHVIFALVIMTKQLLLEFIAIFFK